MSDAEPQDPFKWPGRTIIDEGDLLWQQLTSLKKFSETKKALSALTKKDLQKVVLACLFHEYERRGGT